MRCEGALRGWAGHGSDFLNFRESGEWWGKPLTSGYSLGGSVFLESLRSRWGLPTAASPPAFTQAKPRPDPVITVMLDRSFPLLPLCHELGAVALSVSGSAKRVITCSFHLYVTNVIYVQCLTLFNARCDSKCFEITYLVPKQP